MGVKKGREEVWWSGEGREGNKGRGGKEGRKEGLGETKAGKVKVYESHRWTTGRIVAGVEAAALLCLP